MSDADKIYNLTIQLISSFGPILGIAILLLLIIITGIIIFFFTRMKNISEQISTRAIKIFETSLQRESEKYKIEYSLLTKERADVIKELYRLIVEIEDTQIDHKFGVNGIPFHGNFNNTDGSSVVDGRKYGKSIGDELLNKSNQLFSTYNKNKIFLSDDTCILFEKLINNLHIIWENIGQNYTSDLKKYNFENSDPEKILKFFEALENIPELKKIIEKEFKKILNI